MKHFIKGFIACFAVLSLIELGLFFVAWQFKIPVLLMFVRIDIFASTAYGVYNYFNSSSAE